MARISFFQTFINVSIDGTVQTSFQLRCFSVTEGAEIRAAALQFTHSSFLKKIGKRCTGEERRRVQLLKKHKKTGQDSG